MKHALVAALIWLAAPAPGIAGPQGFAVHDAPQDLPEVRFVTEDGTRKTLDAFHGKVILLNIWATWCPPCAKEMPTLDALQADLGSSKFEVVTLSIDTGGVPVGDVIPPCQGRDLRALAIGHDVDAMRLDRLQF